MILTVIEPFGLFRRIHTREGFSIPVSDEILGSRSAERSARVDIEQQHIFGVRRGIIRLAQFNQIGALPYTAMTAVAGAKRTLVSPFT